MPFSFSMPRRLFTGEGALAASLPALSALGHCAFIVTDATMVKLGMVERVSGELASAGIASEVFDGISGEPTDQMVAAGMRALAGSGCDFLIGLGGGSPIDACKAIAMMDACGGDINGQMGIPLEYDRAPLVAIPTTAGTGSEATQFTIINNTVSNVKMLLAGSRVLPDIAIVDPQFTLTAPPAVTAATGVDALCHALEAATSRKAQPLSLTFSYSAIKRIFASLPTCYEHGDDVVARADMALAATEAGIAFNNASVTVIHGMSRPIGALFHVPHGMSNAMIMMGCLRAVVDGAYPAFARTARETGLSTAADDRTAAEELLAAIEHLLERLNIPTLRGYGIDADAFRAAIPKMAADAIDSGSPANTIKPLTAADLESIYRELIER